MPRASIPAAIGLGLQAFVRVQLEKHGGAGLARFAEAVRGWDEVVACFALTGDMDYLLHVVVADLDHYSRFLMDKLLNAAGVADLNSSFVLQTVKQTGELSLDHLAPEPRPRRAAAAASAASPLPCRSASHARPRTDATAVRDVRGRA